MDVKKPYTFKEQLKKIESRGCTVSDETAAVNFLRQINYYRLTAYFLPFKCKNDTYKPGTTFEKVCSIYEFDRKMRSIVLPVVEEIELMLRTQLSYYHAHKYGALGYLDANNFNHLHKHDVF